MDSTERAVAALAAEVTASPKGSKRLLSKTYWARLGFKVRSVERVREAPSVLDQATTRHE
jgi:hypothetical protein